jgi:hypothetical protein
MKKLQEIRAQAQAKLPEMVYVADHPYDIGYWSARAGLEKPKRGIKGSDLGEFNAGFEAATSEGEPH